MSKMSDKAITDGKQQEAERDKAASRPWKIEGAEITDGNIVIGLCTSNEANMELIIKSVNLHDELVEALRVGIDRLKALDYPEGDESGYIHIMEQAVAKAN